MPFIPDEQPVAVQGGSFVPDTQPTGSFVPDQEPQGGSFAEQTVGRIAKGFMTVGRAFTGIPETAVRQVGLLRQWSFAEDVLREKDPLKQAGLRKKMSESKTVFDATAEALGEAHDWQAQGAETILKNHPEWESDPPESFIELLKDPRETALAIIEALPLLLGAGIMTAAGQPNVATTMMFTSEGQNMKDQVLADGGTEEEAAIAYTIYGLPAAAMEKMQLDKFIKVAKGAYKVILNRVVQKVAKGGLRTATYESMKLAASEAVEEMSQGVWGEITAKMVYDKDIPGDVTDFIDRRAQEAYLGFMMGLIPGGAGAVAGRVQGGKAAPAVEGEVAPVVEPTAEPAVGEVEEPTAEVALMKTTNVMDELGKQYTPQQMEIGLQEWLKTPEGSELASIGRAGVVKQAVQAETFARLLLSKTPNAIIAMEAITSTPKPKPTKPTPITRKKALTLGHTLPKKMGWTNTQRLDFNQKITGKRSMADMKPTEMREVVASMQEQARDLGLLAPEDYPKTLFIGSREVDTQKFIDETVATVAGLKDKAKKLKPMKARRQAKKGRGIIGLTKDITTGINNLSVPHLMRKIGGAAEGVMKEVGITNWRRSIHHKSVVLRGGIDMLNAAIEKAGITNVDLAKMSTSADPRLNLVKSIREFAGKPKTKSYKPTINGKQFDLSMDELMDMYLASLQDKGIGHIESGGFEIRGYETGGIDETSMEKLKAIVEADEKAMVVMNAVIDIADNYNASQLNDTHRRLNPEIIGLIADIKNYWHLEPKQVKKIRGKQTYAISFLENKNILKPRTGGKQPLVIRGLFPRFVTVQSAVAEYVGMAEELRLMNMILNNDSVIKSLETKGYEGVRDNLKSLLDWMVDKESSRTSTDKLLSKIMKGSFRAVLHFSPEVIAAQYMSTMHYAGVIEPKYATLLATPPTPKLVKEMMGHNPVVWQRFYAGGQSAEMAEAGELDVTLRLLTGKHGDINKTGIAIQTTDLAAFAQGWKIAKAITKDSGLKENTTTGEPNLEFWDAVNDKAEELWDTQPSWDKWNKSNITKQRGIKRLPFLFRSYFEKSLMMLHSADAIYEASEHTAVNRSKQAQVYGAVISSQVLVALMRLFTGHFLWRDRKSVWDIVAALATASFGMVAGVGGYLGMAVSNIIRVLGGQKRKWQGEPLSTLPGMIIAEGLEGSYDMSIAAADYLAGDEDKAEQGFKRGTHKLIKSVGTIKGIPVRQVDRIIKAIEADEKKTKYGGGYIL